VKFCDVICFCSHVSSKILCCVSGTLLIAIFNTHSLPSGAIGGRGLHDCTVQ